KPAPATSRIYSTARSPSPAGASNRARTFSPVAGLAGTGPWRDGFAFTLTNEPKGWTRQGRTGSGGSRRNGPTSAVLEMTLSLPVAPAKKVAVDPGGLFGRHVFGAAFLN